MDVAECRPLVAGLPRCELVGASKRACTTLLLNMVKVQRGRAAQFPGSNPVSIERAMLPALTREPYWAAAKTDGQRMFLLAATVNGMRLCVLVDRTLRMFLLGGSLPTLGFDGSLLDGELVQASCGSWFFYVFDAPHLSGLHLAGAPFSSRMAFARAWLLDAGGGPDGVELVAKRFAAYGRERVALPEDVPTDGLVFVPEHHPYVPFRNDKLLKWKARRLHTVDFQVDGDRLLVLNRGKLVEKARLHAADARPELQGRIVECGMAAGAWRVARVREDKAAPNDAYVHGKTVLNIDEDIALEEFST